MVTILEEITFAAMGPKFNMEFLSVTEPVFRRFSKAGRGGGTRRVCPFPSFSPVIHPFLPDPAFPPFPNYGPLFHSKSPFD
jgi:hypothetical protein